MIKMIVLFVLGMCATFAVHAADATVTNVEEAIAAFNVAPSRDLGWKVLDAAKILRKNGGDIAPATEFFSALGDNASVSEATRRLADYWRFELAYTEKRYADARPFAISGKNFYGLYICDRELMTVGQLAPALVAADCRTALAEGIGAMRQTEAAMLLDLWYEAVLAGKLPDAEVKTTLQLLRRVFTLRASKVAAFGTLADKTTALLNTY